jgi:PAS domain S-box-containing protein
MRAGEATASPATASPVTASPVTAGPATASPATAGPVTASPAPGFDLDHADSLGLLRRQTSVLELIAAGTPLAEVLTCVVVALEELIAGSRCSILLLDPATATLHHGAAPSLPADYSALIDGLLVGPQAGSCGAAAYLGRPVVAADIRVDPRWRRFRDVATPHGMRSCWSSPIQGRTGIVGTFAVYHDHPHRPPLRERRLVERFTHLASVAIDHAGLFGALAESEDRFRRAFEDNAVGMVLAGIDGRMVRVNRALRELLGQTEVQLLGRPLDEVVRPAAGAAGQLERLARDRAGSVHYEATARHADGRGIDLAVAASVVHGADGVPVSLSVNLLDITQRRAAERERRARLEAEVARAAAETASRAKSEFVAALNHELRTPLQAITGFTELLRTLDLPPDRRQAALEHIGAATEHVLAMVDDLLDIAKIEADALPIRLEPVELRGLLEEVLALLAPLAAEHGVLLRPAAAAGRTAVRADRRRLRQVLINLVTNGVRYNHAGGWVEVGAAACGPTAGPQAGLGRVAVTVRDSGRGIPADMMSRLFTPFDRLSAERSAEPGAGLGLVVARALTQAMGGALDIRSTAGSGTTAAVTLPAVSFPAVSLPPALPGGEAVHELLAEHGDAAGGEVGHVRDGLAHLG